MKPRSFGRLKNTMPVKIVLIFIGLLVPLYALIYLASAAYIRSLEEQARNNAGAILDIHMLQLENEIAAIDRFYYDLQNTDADFIRLMQWEGTDEDLLTLMKVNRSLVRQVNETAFSEALYLYHEKADMLLFVSRLLSASPSSLYVQQNLDRSWYTRRDPGWYCGEIQGAPFLYHTVSSGDIYLGVLIDLTVFREGIEKQLSYDNAVVTLSENPLENRRLTLSSELSRTGWFINIRLDPKEVDRNLPQIARVLMIVGPAAAVVIPFGLMMLLMHMIIRPIRCIEEGMFRLSNGEQDYRIPDFSASREYVGMKNAFNNMASEIQGLKIRQYEEELEREQMALQNLLLQIRPHFLLNFFNQIFSMAELEDYRGIKKSSLYLSRFFRYLFRSERIAPLKDEFALTEDYMDLMKERFLDCFESIWDIDESLLSLRVPPLIVHSFVENIFKYAVTEGNVITITISLFREGPYAVVSIRDDGPGMEEEILEKIRQEQPVEKADGTHIGIYNANYRLKKLVSPDCRLEVRSHLTEGTEVTIRLPLDT